MALMALSFFACKAFAAGEGGLLTDYSFESTSLAVGTGWAEQGTVGSIATSTGQKYSGTRSVQFQDVTTAYTGRYLLSDTISVAQSTAYSAAVRAYASADGTATIRLKISWYSTHTGTAALASTTSTDLAISSPGTWMRVNFDNQMSDPSAIYAVLEIAAMEPGSAGNNVFIDDACFIQSTTSVDNWKEVK